MSSLPRRASASLLYPLIGHRRAESIAASRRGVAITAARFLADVERVAAALPAANHVLNSCGDRYLFAVALCAAICRGQTTLLPPTTTPNVVKAMLAFAPDVYYITDDPDTALALPRFELGALLQENAAPARHGFEVPQIAADQVVACVFTSGSTGEPQPHFKTWGSLVVDMRGEAKRLAVGASHTIFGTVPPQHMYGFESTVMLPLVTGATLTGERLYFPADIEAAIEAAAPPRILFTTPFHLRAWMESEGAGHIETMVSATAPLSVGLARQAEERTGAQVYEIYGCTEAGQVATRRPTESVEWHALDGLRLWNEGEQAMCSGAHVESPTPLQDVIEVRGDGTRFLLHGRSSDMVNIAGKRNSLGYLNHQLTAIPGVVDGAFFLPDDAPGDGVTRLTAFAVAPGLDARSILAELRQRVDPAFMPRPLLLVDSLPRALSGKLPREALRALAASARKR
ncbi:MAG TPA: AMP-binding protein [Usitatibacter sp.]|nr:AMP-binding protein [Usitatibacter sp.]